MILLDFRSQPISKISLRQILQSLVLQLLVGIGLCRRLLFRPDISDDLILGGLILCIRISEDLLQLRLVHCHVQKLSCFLFRNQYNVLGIAVIVKGQLLIL